jgi:hypothetical protein
MEERRGPAEQTIVPHSGGVEAGDPDWVAPEINTHVAHTARVYDYWLGGKDNFPADHALAEAILGAVPSMRAMARANRAFLGRAVRYLAGEAGIRQFLDIGTGIPTAGNTTKSPRWSLLTPGWCVWTTTLSCWRTRGR